MMPGQKISGKSVTVMLMGKDGILNPGIEDEGFLVIDIAHHNVHEGRVFVAENTITSVLNGNNHDMRIKTGPIPVHSTIATAAGGRCYISVYEGATVSGGTAVSAYNQDRTRTSVSNTSVWHTPSATIPSGKAIVNNRLLEGGATQTTRVGGSIRMNTELILIPDTEYVIRVNNASGSSIPIWIGIEFYDNEHRD